jgi:hypothetical protein
MTRITIELPEDFARQVAVELQRLSEGTFAGANTAPPVQAVPNGAQSQPADPWAPNGGAVQAAPAQQFQQPTQQFQQPTQAAAPAMAPQGQQNGSVQPPAQGTYPVLNDRTGQTTTYYVGVPGAPVCTHGFPAAKATGMGKNGREFTAWRCALRATNWRQACKFNAWA